MAMDRCAKTVIFHLVSIFLMGLEAETSTIVQYPSSVTLFEDSCDKPNSLKSSQFDWMWVAVAGGVTILITLTLLVVIAVLVRRNKAYALLVRECTSFDSAKEPELPHRNKVQSHANHQHEESYLHCHGNEVKTKQKRGPQTRKNMQ
ncbi:uncharacterized protein [Heptranchias perlo]|uniref:uncharacterized protein isoform X2 n=1 Tax=Heptranchias perlo TaxID=212740 RepID=UPI00355A094D